MDRQERPANENSPCICWHGGGGCFIHVNFLLSVVYYALKTICAVVRFCEGLLNCAVDRVDLRERINHTRHTCSMLFVHSSYLQLGRLDLDFDITTAVIRVKGKSHLNIFCS